MDKLSKVRTTIDRSVRKETRRYRTAWRVT